MKSANHGQSALPVGFQSFLCRDEILGTAFAKWISMILNSASDIGEVMKKVTRFMSWWFVTVTFCAFVVLEVTCVYYAMLFMGMLPK